MLTVADEHGGGRCAGAVSEEPAVLLGAVALVDQLEAPVAVGTSQALGNERSSALNAGSTTSCFELGVACGGMLWW